MKRASDQRRVVVAIHSNRTIPTGTLAKILNDAALSADELHRLL